MAGSRSVLAGSGRGGEGPGHKETFGGGRNVWYLDYGGFPLHTYVRILQIVQFKYMQFIVK